MSVPVGVTSAQLSPVLPPLSVTMSSSLPTSTCQLKSGSIIMLAVMLFTISQKR